MPSELRFAFSYFFVYFICFFIRLSKKKHKVTHYTQKKDVEFISHILKVRHLEKASIRKMLLYSTSGRIWSIDHHQR